MLQEFKQLTGLKLNLRRIANFNFDDGQFIENFATMYANLKKLEDFSINISQIQSNNELDSL